MQFIDPTRNNSSKRR